MENETIKIKVEIKNIKQEDKGNGNILSYEYKLFENGEAKFEQTSEIGTPFKEDRVAFIKTMFTPETEVVFIDSPVELTKTDEVKSE